MKSKLLPDLQVVSNDPLFSLTADEISASFIPRSQPASVTATAPSGILATTMPSDTAPGPIPDTISAQAPLSDFTSVPISLGGITINLLFDATAMSAPASFREGIEQGATLLASAITDKITVNFRIYYDATDSSGGAGAVPAMQVGLSYSQVRANLISHAAAGDTTFNALPEGTSISGFDPDTSKIIPETDVWLANAQSKVWGLLGANDTTTDDSLAIFSSNIDPSLLAGVALHELTHGLGRAPIILDQVLNFPTPDVFDLFRFVSPGVRLFQSYGSADPTLPAYFSVDGGVTKLADYDQLSDPSDFLNTGVQGATDPFDAHYSSNTTQLLTALDLEQMTALGFHMSSVLPVTLVDVSGSTRIDQVGLFYYLDQINGVAESGPLLKFNGAPVYTGEFTTSGTWSPIGAEQTATGYEVALRVPGTDQYTIWNTDGEGNFLSIGGNGGTMSGTSPDLELAEFSFQQDLNADGHIGIVNVIESSGSTKLDLFANNYFLDPATGAGPSLKYNDVAVVPRQFGAFAPIGAERTASGGYEIAWKDFTGTFLIWNTDSNGNYVSTILDHVAGTDATLQSQETFFQQDLNGDGHIGIVTVIESSGSTKLDLFANNYFLDPATGAGPSLKFNGVAVVPGQFGTWAPIASEQTATGFDVAWKDSATGNFRVWATDSTGNYTSTLLDNVAGSNTDFEALETTFNEDLNGDSVTGVWTVVEGSGLTRLDLINNHYFLNTVGAGPHSGPSLKNAGVLVTPGFAGLNAIGVEVAFGTGYEVAFKAPAADQYSVWFTDNNGNYLSTFINSVSGTNWNLESTEWKFNQDLNGDGVIGVPAIETSGFTSLDLAENHYFLDSNSGAQGPTLKFNGAAVVIGQFGSLTPIGAEQTANGYEVAWKVAGADQYTVWTTDTDGNYLSTPINGVSGTSSSLEAVEDSFLQDLNGDGFIGIPPTVTIEAFGSTRLDGLGLNYFLDPVSGGFGPTLKYNGAAVVIDQFGALTPIGAEKTVDGYEVAWKVNGADEYSVWLTDSNGNYISTSIDSVSGIDPGLEAAELSFQQDLNGDGFLGIPPTVVIEAIGATRLDRVGLNYFLDPVSGGSGPLLKFHGSPVVSGQFGALTPIGVEQTADGYKVAWKAAGADQYVVWNTDNNGNYVGDTGTLSGASMVLEAAEIAFHQDLNGDGTIGIPPTIVEAFGSTRLDVAGNTYSLDPVSGGQGPSLMLGGVPLDVSLTNGFLAIGAEKLANGNYEVAWKVPNGTFDVWTTDSNGNYISDSGLLLGDSTELLSLETSFQQDLNGDGVIGIPNVEASGSTRLDQFGSNYFLDSVGGVAGPSLKYQGAAVTVGEFGSWTPLGTEQTASGYEVAWKVVGADEYQIWNTDTNGNFVSTGGALTGASIVLEAAEVSFHQDFNGDDVIGVAPTVIEHSGATQLDLAGSTYTLDPVSGGHGPTLNFQGAAVVPGEFGSWTAIGAEQTSSGYEIAWKVDGADQYIVWTTDSSGNYLTQTGALTGTSIVLEAAEVSFHQDLNGDGRIGVALTTIEAFGSTKLDLAGATYSLDPVSGGQGPILKYQGAPVIPGEFGSWTAIGAEHTANGYEVAWKVDGADQYLIWNTDNSGNYVSQGPALAGASFALETVETSFHQDLNGDGAIGVPNVEAFGATKLDLVGNTYSLDPVSGGQGPSLKNAGMLVAPGFSGMNAIGAEQTGTGYEVAWKDATGAFSIWNTDSNGNYISTILDHVAGSNTSLQSQETFFQQDLNGNGVVGVPPTPPGGPDGGPVQSPPASGPGGDSFVFQPSLGASTNLGASSVAAPANTTTADLPGLPQLSELDTLILQHVNEPQELFSAQDQLASLLHTSDLHSGVLIH